MSQKVYIVLITLVFVVLAFGVVVLTSNHTARDPAAAPEKESPANAAIAGNSPLPEPTGPHAKIDFPELIHDFGKQITNSELKYSFKFTNKGDSVLLIEKVKAG
jgi:hypothetical protein